MMPTSRRVAFCALLAAAALHIGGLVRLDLTSPVQMEGGIPGTAEATLGDAFADLSEGTLSSIEPTETLRQVVPEQMPDTAHPPEYAVLPKTKAAQRPISPIERPVEVQPLEKTRRPQSDQLSALTPEVDGFLPSAPLRSPLVEPEKSTVLQPEKPVESKPIEPLALLERAQPEDLSVLEHRVSPTTQVATANEPQDVELERSLRPKLRPTGLQKPPSEPEPVRTTLKRQPKAPAGNSTENAKAGQADGSAKAPDSQRATSGTSSAQPGNAAVSNYPGKVMRKLQRVRRPRVGSRGATTVAFKIASNGGLSALSISQSSGSPALDDAAMKVIRHAAPFPVPPKGAQRSFSIQIKGR